MFDVSHHIQYIYILCKDIIQFDHIIWILQLLYYLGTIKIVNVIE